MELEAVPVAAAQGAENEECQVYSVVPLRVDFGFNKSCFSDRLLRIEIAGSEVVGQTVHVNSLVLAAQSPFFHELFTSHENAREVSVSVANHLEALGLQKLLEFMYSRELPEAEGLQLMSLLLAGHKYGVGDCVTKCMEKLSRREMNLELAAALFHALPTGQGMDIVSATVELYLLQNLCRCYKRGEHKHLSARIMEFVLSSDNFHVSSEYDAYKMVKSWAVDKFPSASEREEVLNRLLPHVRFQLMSTQELKSILDEGDRGYDCSPHVIDALLKTRRSFGGQAPRCGRSLWTSVELLQPRYHVQLMLHITAADLAARKFVLWFDMEGRKIKSELWFGNRGVHLLVRASRSEFSVQFLRRGKHGLKELRNICYNRFQGYAFLLKDNNKDAHAVVNVMKILKPKQ